MAKTKYVASGGLAFEEEKDMEKLENLARKGWTFDKFYFLGYKLKKSSPQDLQYAIDYRKEADQDYFAYFAEAGWRHEGSSGDYIHLFSAPKGTAPIYTDKPSILEKYENEKSSMGKAALITLLINICIAAVYSFVITLDFFHTYESTIKIVFAIVQLLAVICLVFTGLPYLGYVYRVKKWRNSGL
ncbi:hypothetical protein A8F94_08010 [Bacillus sp. FJAT-27225]|uniref:DUF2812 domain-containing protein n=1 Tax=Bacillus sp. FJAT-27225 TaxID=1743144 RepID=UPI00080C2C3C|nr:DUF2812 domain-containing protein [Bacillus sp. FJAT-27225]OCA87779.1 hypothetical protein A8F94_08010 [Bacillus sp. FJAT-27225]